MARYTHYDREFESKDDLIESFFYEDNTDYLLEALGEFDYLVILHHLDEDFLDTLTQRAMEIFMEEVVVIDDEEEEEGE